MKPAIIVISSHVVRGTVGNRAAAFALEVMGFPVWCLPTIVLPWHPGHGPATRQVAPDETFGQMIDDLIASPWLSEVGAVLSGYLASVEQVSAVGKLVDAVKRRNPAATYTLDPVLGDNGSLYIPEAIANAIRTKLVKHADLTTPNCFELSWLTGSRSLDSKKDIHRAALSLGVPKVLTTSVPMGESGSSGNLLVSKDLTVGVGHPCFDKAPNGLGDLTSALITGHLMEGLSPSIALLNTTQSVFDVVDDATTRGSNELALENMTEALRSPSGNLRLSYVTPEV